MSHRVFLQETIFFLTEAERQIGAAARSDIINHLREFWCYSKRVLPPKAEYTRWLRNPLTPSVPEQKFKKKQKVKNWYFNRRRFGR